MLDHHLQTRKVSNHELDPQLTYHFCTLQHVGEACHINTFGTLSSATSKPAQCSHIHCPVLVLSSQ
jgi:hypothetical protein